MMDNNYSIYAAAEAEADLFYSHDSGLDEETGCIGHLRGDFDEGNQFYTTFWDHAAELKMQPFMDELDKVVNHLRRPKGVLNCLKAMRDYINAHPALKLDSWNNDTRGYKLETESFCYYIRCSPARGDYNFYIYCYEKSRLKKHMEGTQKIKE